jgi:hypothetical protein
VRIFRQSILGLAVLGFAYLIVRTVFFLPQTPCAHASLDEGPSFLIVSASVGGFLGGHLAGRWLEGREPGNRREGGRTVRVMVQLGLLAFLGIAAGLLSYETWAVADPVRDWPITWYMRCYAHLQPGWTALGAAGFCFLIGEWLWSRD